MRLSVSSRGVKNLILHKVYRHEGRRTAGLAVRKVRAVLDEKRYHPRGHLFLDKVLLGLLSKGIMVAEAVICLVEAEYPEEAFGLSRTLVEIALNARFIANRDSERRAKRFVDYFARWKMEQLRRTIKHMPHHGKSNLIAQVRDYKKLVKLAQKFPDRNSWTVTRNRKASRGGAWRLANEPDRHEQGNRWEFDYDWIYFWTSQYVHATVVSIDRHAVVPPEAFAVHIAPGRGRHTGELALFNSVLYVHKLLVLTFRGMGHTLPEELTKPLEEAITEMRVKNVPNKSAIKKDAS